MANNYKRPLSVPSGLIASLLLTTQFICESAFIPSYSAQRSFISSPETKLRSDVVSSWKVKAIALNSLYTEEEGALNMKDNSMTQIEGIPKVTVVKKADDFFHFLAEDDRLCIVK